jgi:AraC-like DNA-binding protein
LAELHTYEASSLDLSRRFAVISNAISETFRAPWEAQGLGEIPRPARFNWAGADGVSYSLAEMPALRLTNNSPASTRAPTFNVFSADQRFLIKIPGRPNVHMQPDELVIMASDMPCEIIVPRDYKTTAFIIDGDIFRTAVPQAFAYLARPLRLKCQLETVLHSTMDAAWNLSRAGLFESAGPHLVRALLEVLAALPSPLDESTGRPRRDGLEIRRCQAKEFIERNFACPDLTVAGIASQLRMSQRYLQLAFKGEGVTPLEYLRKCRLKASSRLLRDPRHSQRSITEICFSCGFNSAPHFSREFRHEYGVSPREYRFAEPFAQSSVSHL